MSTEAAGRREPLSVEGGLPAVNAPGRARACVRWVVRAAMARASAVDREDCAFDAALVASELVTNAVRHGSPPVRLRVSALPGAVRIEVADAGGGTPHGQSVPGDALGGRGLALVAEISDTWGVVRRPPGKVVHATVPFRSPHLVHRRCAPMTG